jgi:Fur family ferric uptake transcriptional regulator
MILLAVHECEGHVTADEIYAHVREQNACVDISTVYRNLELLRDLGLVVRIETGDGTARYEVCFGQTPHHHLLCLQCGGIVDLPDAVLDPVRQRIQAEYSYAPRVNHLVLHGTCPTCQEAHETSEEGG